MRRPCVINENAAAKQMAAKVIEHRLLFRSNCKLKAIVRVVQIRAMLQKDIHNTMYMCQQVLNAPGPAIDTYLAQTVR